MIAVEGRAHRLPVTARLEVRRHLWTQAQALRNLLRCGAAAPEGPEEVHGSETPALVLVARRLSQPARLVAQRQHLPLGQDLRHRCRPPGAYGEDLPQEPRPHQWVGSAFGAPTVERCAIRLHPYKPDGQAVAELLVEPPMLGLWRERDRMLDVVADLGVGPDAASQLARAREIVDGTGSIHVHV